MFTRYAVELKGLSPIIMHDGIKGLDPTNPYAKEIAVIAKKRAADKTEADLNRMRECECFLALWLEDDEQTPTIPSRALRSCIEAGARKIRQGPAVREGLVVDSVQGFDYDREKLGTDIKVLVKTTQFTVPVRVQRARVNRTRARFDTWAVRFTVECYDDLVDREKLHNWLTLAGRRCGLGDWNPTHSGEFGRFEVVRVEALPE